MNLILKVTFCWLTLACLLLIASSKAMGFQETLTTPTYSGGDGTYASGTLGGLPVSIPDAYLYFRLSGTFPSGATAYLKVIYYDDNTSKRLTVQYDATAGAYTTTTYHTRSSCEGINAFATSCHRLDAPVFAHRQNGGSDFRFTGEIPIQSVVVQDMPFSDPVAQQALALIPPWTQEYSGRTRDDVNASTIKGKILAGYQGWFRTPNDLDDIGFAHWTVDQWPDPNDYDPASLHTMPGATTVAGKPGYVFSAADPAVVRRHFEWMRKYNMDGIYLQRFFGAATAGGGTEWVLSNVRAAAHQEGRVWAIEYDLSGGDDTTLVSQISADWKWLVDTCHITQDSRYLHEGGKPVVVLWGASIRTYLSVGPLNDLVDFFHNDPVYGSNYVVGCVSPSFPSAWETNYAKYDSIFAWQGGVPGYQNIAAKAAQYGIQAQMHVWPGFSWHNLNNLVFPTQYTDRTNGQFYWGLISGGLNVLSPEAVFVGMFDEYNEGTAVMPMSDDPPLLTGSTGHYVTNAGSSKDWWLTLSGRTQETLTKQVAYSGTMPTETALANRSNIGEELSASLGSVNSSNLLQQVEFSGDGTTVSSTLAGIPCRRATNYYMYFKVDDSVIYKSSQGTDVTVIVDYFDAGGVADLGLQYDGASGAYTTHPKSFTVGSISSWRSARFEIADANFGNRENGSSDFRLKSMNGAHGMNISRVRVILPEAQILTFTQDIGATGLNGGSVCAGGICTMLGSGSGVGATADAFRFSYLPITGDCTVTARVISILNGNASSKAGVMIRESLATGSKQAMISQTIGAGALFQCRASTSNTTTGLTVSGTLPNWVRINRTGNVFTGFVSMDGSAWTQAGTQTISMATSAYAGLGVTAQDNTALCTAVFDNVSITYPSGNAIATVQSPFSAVPVAPSALTGTAGDGNVALTWTGVATADTYLLWRKLSTDPSYSLLAAGLTSTSYSDSGLANGTLYNYLVTAENSEGSSPNSGVLSATPLSAAQAWRQTYFGTLSNTGAAADSADPDGDGQSNLAERIAGTNPMSATDVFRADALAGSNATFTFRFPAKTGHSYVVEYTSDLIKANWQPVETIPVVADGVISRNYSTTLGRGFYRARTSAP